MTFQRCFVIWESSIRERISAWFIVASDIGEFPAIDTQVHARRLPKRKFGCLAPFGCSAPMSQNCVNRLGLPRTDATAQLRLLR